MRESVNILAEQIEWGQIYPMYMSKPDKISFDLDYYYILGHLVSMFPCKNQCVNKILIQFVTNASADQRINFIFRIQ